MNSYKSLFEPMNIEQVSIFRCLLPTMSRAADIIAAREKIEARLEELSDQSYDFEGKAERAMLTQVLSWIHLGGTREEDI